MKPKLRLVYSVGSALEQTGRIKKEPSDDGRQEIIDKIQKNIDRLQKLQHKLRKMTKELDDLTKPKRRR